MAEEDSGISLIVEILANILKLLIDGLVLHLTIAALSEVWHFPALSYAVCVGIAYFIPRLSRGGRT